MADQDPFTLIYLGFIRAYGVAFTVTGAGKVRVNEAGRTLINELVTKYSFLYKFAGIHAPTMIQELETGAGKIGNVNIMSQQAQHAFGEASRVYQYCLEQLTRAHVTIDATLNFSLDQVDTIKVTFEVDVNTKSK